MAPAWLSKNNAAKFYNKIVQYRILKATQIVLYFFLQLPCSRFVCVDAASAWKPAG
jgi:hypothetical protein